MSRSVLDIINVAVRELWGWHPNVPGQPDRMLTPKQQLAIVKEELEYQFHTRGVHVTKLDVVETEPDHGLRVSCVSKGIFYNEVYPPAWRSHYTMQAESEVVL